MCSSLPNTKKTELGMPQSRMSHAILPRTRPARVPNNSDLHVVLVEEVLQEFGDAVDPEHLAQ
eukprot:1449805-Pyramimonas_sp.AAC.1